MKRSLAPRDVFGTNAFALLLDALLWEVSDVARYLHVAPRTVQRWLDGTTCVPRSAVIALWFESHYGHAAIAAQTMNECASWRGIAKGLARDKAALLERLSLLCNETNGAANAAVFSVASPLPPSVSTAPRTQAYAPLGTS